MRKSKIVSLVLITALLASCHKEKEWNEDEQKVYMRGDNTASYEQTHHSNNLLLWYLAFRPYGGYYGGSYHYGGMYSPSISHNSNIGTNSHKTSISSSRSVVSSRGGFGSSSHSSSAS
jgi:hypothetical protein